VNLFSSSALALRRRSVWEAADSGLLLWRDNFFYFIPFFAIPAWSVACGLRLVPAGLSYLPFLILWWMKPFFDRLILQVISLRFFNSETTEHLKDLRRGLAGTVFRGLLGDLLWRRFSPGRGSRMPIRILERIHGKQYRERKKALAGGGLNFCFFLSAACLSLEAVLLLGEALFVITALQIFNPAVYDYLQNNLDLSLLLIFIMYCVNFILVESLYVCMGFGLYINSRVEVEGWDLQLLFQKFAGESRQAADNRKKKPKSEMKNALALCLLFAFFLFPLPMSAGTAGNNTGENNSTEYNSAENASAESNSVELPPVQYFPDNFPSPSEASIESLKEILSSPDFGYEKEGWGIKFKYGREPNDTPDIELSPLLEKLKQIFGLFLKLTVISAAAASLGFAVYWLRRFHREGRFRRSGEKPGMNMYGNPLLSREKPEALFAKAEDLFRRGALREAWAACLSGCLAAFTAVYSLYFPADATEYGCLALVNESLPGEKETFKKAFAELVCNWILFAYGGRPPAAGSFEEALSFGRSLLQERYGSGGTGAGESP